MNIEKKYIPAKYLMSITKGKSTKTNKDATENGKYLFFTGGEERLRTNTYKYDFETIIISDFRCIDKLNMHYVIGEKFDTTCHAIMHHNFDISKIIPKFFYYFAKSNFSNYAKKWGIPTTTVFTANTEMFKNFPVLVPTLEQQKEIVDFLDKQFQTINILKDKLSLLKQQLQKYEKEIIKKTNDFDFLINNVGNKNIKNTYKKIPAKYLMSISKGNNKKRNTDAIENGKYLFFTGEPKCFKTNTYVYECESVIISAIRCIYNLKMHYVCDQKFDTTTSAVIHHNFDLTKIIPKFFYWYAKSNFSNYAKQLGIPVTTFLTVSLENFKNFPVLVPTLEQQKEIVDFLDKKYKVLFQLKDKIKKSVELLKKYEFWVIYDNVQKFSKK